MLVRLALLATLVLVPMTVRAETIERHCDNRREIVVAAGQAGGFAEICRTAEGTIDFLAQFGIHPQRAIHVRVVEKSIVSEGYDAFGRYDSRADLIELMSYAAIVGSSAAPEMYDEPFDRVHYRGAIAHEIAHAVMQHNLLTELISPAPQEYLAHAAQLASMPEERRVRVLEHAGVGPWEPGDAISDIYMAMQPARFAVKSYLHLTSLREPEAFVRILLNANWFYVYVPNEEARKRIQ